MIPLLESSVVSYTTFSPLPPHPCPSPIGKEAGMKELFVSVVLIQQIAPFRGFPGTAPYEVRTFLDNARHHRDRPTNLRLFHHTRKGDRRQSNQIQ